MLGRGLGEWKHVPLRPELESPEAPESWLCDHAQLQTQCCWGEMGCQDKGLPRNSQGASLVYTVVPHSNGPVSDMVEDENQPKAVICPPHLVCGTHNHTHTCKRMHTYTHMHTCSLPPFISLQKQTKKGIKQFILPWQVSSWRFMVMMRVLIWYQ